MTIWSRLTNRSKSLIPLILFCLPHLAPFKALAHSQELCVGILKEPIEVIELSPQERFERRERLNISFGKGRNILIDFVESDSSHPTFFLMPGINRAYELNEPVIQKLVQKGFGVATLTLSAQYNSVLASQDPSYLEKESPNFQSLMDEVRQAQRTLEQHQKVKGLIPVSLSYSGIFSPLLEGSTLVIDTVPMTSENAANPQGARSRKSLSSVFAWNPFVKVFEESMIQSAYESHWKAYVDSLGPNLNLSLEQKRIITKGYVALSRAAENNSWNVDEMIPTRRVFILGENEAPTLLLHQLQTFRSLREKNKTTSLILIQNAGHAIFTDQPSIFARFIAKASSPQFAPEGILLVVSPSNKESNSFKLKALKGSDIDRQVNDWIKNLNSAIGL